MKKEAGRIGSGLAVGLALSLGLTSPSIAAVYSINNNANGGLIRADEDEPTTVETGGNPNGERRVGTSSDPDDTLSSVYFFELPEYDDFNEMVDGGASRTSMSFFYDDIDGSPNFNVDVYGLGYVSDPPSLDPDWHFEGTTDSTTRASIGTGSTGTVVKVGEDALTTSTPTGRTQVTASNVRSFLESLYADGAQGGDYAVFRLNADQDSNAVNGTGVGYNVVHSTAGGHSGDLANITIRPNVVAHDTFAGASTGSVGGVGTGSGLNTATGWSVSGTSPGSVVNPGTELTFTNDVGTINGGSTAVSFNGAYDGSTNLNNNPLRRQLDTPFTGDDLYFRFMIQKTDANPMDSNDFVVLWLDSNTGDFNDDDAEHSQSSLFMGINGTGNSFARLYGVSTQMQANEAIAGGTQNDTTYTLVGHLYRDQPTDGYNRLDFWLDPDSIDLLTPDGSIAFSGANPSFDQVASLGFRTGQSTELSDEFTVDGIVLGTTWASVVPVPEPTTGLMLGVFGAIAARRRRRSSVG